MTDPTRVRRHSERVRELVASVVRTQIKDPRLGMLTITDARLTADLRDATVFYTVLGDAAAKAGTAAALESAKGLLRSTVGRALGLRHSPSLTFVLDEVQDHAKHIDDLLDRARKADAEVHELAKRAEYAGDPRPYRLEEDEDEDLAAPPAADDRDAAENADGGRFPPSPTRPRAEPSSAEDRH
jgi:ribosome-binding factor A